MAVNLHSREQRLRKQAELQSLYINLANLRKQEATYIEAYASIPDLLFNQISELRQKIQQVESELLRLEDDSIESPGRQFYQQAFEAELAHEFDQAFKLYKNASRHAHPDANAAARSLRYVVKTSKNKPGAAGKNWIPETTHRSRNWLLIGGGTLSIGALLLFLSISGFFSAPPPQAVAVESPSTAIPTLPAVILIIPDTPTPLPTHTPTDIPPTATPMNTPTPGSVATLTPTPSPVPTLLAAPKIVGPKDGLVWEDGAIVFEFERLDLKYDEWYCLNTLRGFDRTNTENWSFSAVGSKEPYIPIEPNVFRIAKLQGIRCVVWSAAIGKGGCNNIISQNTEERVIGMPGPCDFK